ncbi:MAG: sensor histidine kinase [Actinomycetota bacterium]
MGRRLLTRILFTHLLIALAAIGLFALSINGLLGNDPRVQILGVSAAMVAVAATTAVLVARSLSRPLKIMSEQVESIAGGDEAVLVTASGPLEQQALAKAVSAMAENLAMRLQQLASETRLREQVLASMSVGVLLTNADGDAIYSNPAAEKIVGLSSNFLLKEVENGVSEFTFHHPVRRDLRVTSVALDDGSRLVLLEDLTEVRRVELMRRDFVADASHELKTPVGGILAAAETLDVASREDPGRVPQFVAALLHEAKKLARLVQELLDLARLERTPTESKPIHLSGLIRRQAADIAILAAGKGLKVETDIAGGIVVNGNAEELGQAIRNILENALRYTSEGIIRVSVSRQEGLAVVEVADTGAGIPNKDLERIFERFYRVDPARSRETGGTGLGLSIARHAIQRHNGKVSAKSELGKGSVFKITLPIE